MQQTYGSITENDGKNMCQFYGLNLMFKNLFCIKILCTVIDIYFVKTDSDIRSQV